MDEVMKLRKIIIEILGKGEFTISEIIKELLKIDMYVNPVIIREIVSNLIRENKVVKIPNRNEKRFKLKLAKKINNS